MILRCLLNRVFPLKRNLLKLKKNFKIKIPLRISKIVRTLNSNLLMMETKIKVF